MANKELFNKNIKDGTNTINEAGGTAYKLSCAAALAQFAMTGCLNDIYYLSAEGQLATVKDLIKGVDDKTVAQIAIYSRKSGFMKDMPALITAALAARKSPYFEKVFTTCIDNVKMLRNFVQMIRSGEFGSKNLTGTVRRVVKDWFKKQNDITLFKGKVGNNPSISDILRLVHPKPQSQTQEALFAYLCGKNVDIDRLPELARQFEQYKTGNIKVVPDVPFELLTALNLNTDEWTEIARNANWHMTRMNLNTFQRHGVFENKEVVQLVANRLRDKELIQRSRVFPYQLLVAYTATEDSDIPREIISALHDALEVSTYNVPRFEGNVYVFVDVSGSMNSPVTGYRKGATSTVTCTDIACLFGAAILRTSPNARVIPFDTGLHNIKLEPKDSVMTNAQRLACIQGGGTDCSVGVWMLATQKKEVDLVVYISDNESWVDSEGGQGLKRTNTKKYWDRIRKTNPEAKLVNINIQPSKTTQACDDKSIINIGGFSDKIFEIIENFTIGNSQDHWLDVIRKVEL